MDLISRDDAIKTIHEYFIKLLDKTPTETDEDGDTVYSDMKTVNSLLTINKWLTKEIKAIPAIEERKEGEWVELQQNDDGTHNIQCSICRFCFKSKGHARSYYTKKHYAFCPHCGMKMKGAE